jgi:hypothetical protein
LGEKKPLTKLRGDRETGSKPISVAPNIETKFEVGDEKKDGPFD